VATTPAEAKPEHSGLSFGDLLDVINPLQHIPIISTIYRRITGDTMSPAAEIAGGALYGGIVGTVASVADVLFTQETGKDFGETVFAWLGLGAKDGVKLAKNDAPKAPVAPATARNLPRPQALIAPLQQRTAVAPGLPALMGSMQKQGVDPALAARAAFAYRSAIGWRAEQSGAPAPAY
jgi:hypothetical protein